MSLLDLVYLYRTLQGRCELGTGLEIDEIAALTELESEFVLDPGANEGRRVRREDVVFHAVLRGDGLHDRVAVTDFGPGGLAVKGAPYAAEGDRVEIVIEAGDCSYRFKGVVAWVEDDGDDYELGMSFVGMPVRIHHGPPSAPLAENAVHRIAA